MNLNCHSCRTFIPRKKRGNHNNNILSMRVFTVQSEREREIFASFFPLASPKTKLAGFSMNGLLMFRGYCEVSLAEQWRKQFQVMLLLFPQINISEMHHNSQLLFFKQILFGSKKF